MKSILERIVKVDEVRPRDFDANTIPVTKKEYDFLMEYVPFSLTHSFVPSKPHAVENMRAVLFNRAIKMESTFAKSADSVDYIAFELEKCAPLLAPFTTLPQMNGSAERTMYDLKMALSSALQTLSSDISFIARRPDYMGRKGEFKDAMLVDELLFSTAQDVGDNFSLLVYGSVTNLAHNNLKNGFSDVDTTLIVPIASFDDYKNLLSLVHAGEHRKGVPLSLNLVPQGFSDAYLVSDVNNVASPEKSILYGGSVPAPLLSDETIQEKNNINIALNLLRAKKAVNLYDGRDFHYTSLPVFNAKGKKSNLAVACMRSASDDFPEYPLFSSRVVLPQRDEARNIFIEQSIAATKVFEKYVR